MKLEGSRELYGTVEPGPHTVDLGRGVPDSLALALVARLQAQLPDAQVLLFGSRAVGDWHPGSDADLAVIGGDREATEKALAHLQNQVPHPRAQLFHFAPAEFAELRVSQPHIAGQVQAHGLTAAGEHLPPMDQHNPWPGVQGLLHAARRKLETALIVFDTQPSSGEIALSLHGTLERCLKAAQGTEGVDFRKHVHRNDQHNVCALAELLSAEVYANLTTIMPVDYLQQLEAYQSTALYDHDSRVQWPTTDNETLLAAAQRASLYLADHALSTLGKTPRDIGYEQRMVPDALGGFGTVALDHYAHGKLGKRERQHIVNSERVRDLNMLLGSKLKESQLERVESNWFTHNAPDDVVARIVNVMVDPSTWLDLLVKTGDRETDADTSPPLRDQPPPRGV